MRFVVGVSLLVVSACGGPAGGGSDPMKIEVPPQPPPVAPMAVAAVPDASAPIAARAFSCAAPGYRFTAQDKELCGHTTPMGWEDAEARCVSEGGHLLALENEHESMVARQTLGSQMLRPDIGRAAWIGLEIADKKKRTWKWADGEAVTQTSWGANEPNNWDGNELCGEWTVAKGWWNDTRCNLQQPYLCEARPGATLVCSTTRFGDKEYCWVPVPASYADAKKSCAKFGGILAMPKAETVQASIRDGMGQRFPVKEFWMGLNELAQEGNWLWTTGASLAIAKWKPEEPNGYRGNEHCAEAFVDSWTWNDVDCAEKLPFVCQSGSGSRR